MRPDYLDSFSALQRAENSSMPPISKPIPLTPMFQCSSASRKFLNRLYDRIAPVIESCFSALQRAENSSMGARQNGRQRRAMFQCSSASRKFLNPTRRGRRGSQAEVSVLFSEPKIPQFGWWTVIGGRRVSFSALQRAENSSIESRAARG